MVLNLSRAYLSIRRWPSRLVFVGLFTFAAQSFADQWYCGQYFSEDPDAQHQLSRLKVFKARKFIVDELLLGVKSGIPRGIFYELSGSALQAFNVIGRHGNYQEVAFLNSFLSESRAQHFRYGIATREAANNALTKLLQRLGEREGLRNSLAAIDESDLGAASAAEQSSKNKKYLDNRKKTSTARQGILNEFISFMKNLGSEGYAVFEPSAENLASLAAAEDAFSSAEVEHIHGLLSGSPRIFLGDRTSTIFSYLYYKATTREQLAAAAAERGEKLRAEAHARAAAADHDEEATPEEESKTPEATEDLSAEAYATQIIANENAIRLTQVRQIVLDDFIGQAKSVGAGNAAVLELSPESLSALDSVKDYDAPMTYIEDIEKTLRASPRFIWGNATSQALAQIKARAAERTQIQRAQALAKEMAIAKLKFHPSAQRWIDAVNDNDLRVGPEALAEVSDELVRKLYPYVHLPRGRFFYLQYYGSRMGLADLNAEKLKSARAFVPWMIENNLKDFRHSRTHDILDFLSLAGEAQDLDLFLKLHAHSLTLPQPANDDRQSFDEDVLSYWATLKTRLRLE